MIDFIGIAIMAVFTLVGVSLHVVGIPGNFIVFLGAVLASLLTGWEALSAMTILLLFGIVLSGEILDFFLGLLLAKGGGVSSAGVWGGLIGGIVGAVAGLPLPIVGNIVGAFAGAFAGSVLLEWGMKGEMTKAVKAGSLVLVGRVISGSLKIGIGLGIGAYVILSLI